jgi:long-chain fatty acid transport protein
MGGAFSALSDDVSGAFYNPAGLAFVTNTNYTINASTYQSKKLDNQNFFGPGQNYTQSSRNYLPNFIGFVKKLDNLTVGFTIATRVNETYDQSDRANSPLYLRRSSQVDISIVRDKLNILAGPSASLLLSDKLSLGITSYFDYTSSRLISSITENTYTNSVTTNFSHDSKKTFAITPILGIQYMPLSKLSLGGSIRRNYIFSGEVDSKINSTSTGNTASSVYQGSNKFASEIRPDGILIKSPLTYKLPEVYEVRGGFAYFINNRLLISGDLIYTSGYRLLKSEQVYSVNNKKLSFTDPLENEFTREHTLNYAFGFELYITDFIILRMGTLSNRSNSKKIRWLDEASLSYLRNLNGGNFLLPLGENLTYSLGEKRTQYINLIGYSIGMGY